jgi:hypothetical protein
MANKETISIKPDQSDLKSLYAVLKTMDKETNTKLKTEVSAISAWTARQIQGAANLSPYPKQAARVLSTTRGNKDRVPNVTIGGSKSRFSGGAVSGQVLFGNEFGANPTSVNGQFPNGGRRFPMPSKGYVIFATLKQSQGEITRRWKRAVEQVLNNW